MKNKLAVDVFQKPTSSYFTFRPGLHCVYEHKRTIQRRQQKNFQGRGATRIQAVLTTKLESFFDIRKI